MKDKILKYLLIRNHSRINQPYLLRELFEKSPYCYYCKVETKLYEDVRKAHGEAVLVQRPDDMATVEHLYSLLDKRRYVLDFYSNLVLACYKCNTKRSVEDQSQLPRELKIRLSRNPRPKGMPRPLYLLEMGVFDEDIQNSLVAE